MKDGLERHKFSSNAVIKVIGVGGGGGNALNTMIESGLAGVEFIAANTDVQALHSNLAPIKIQLGRELTKGLGAGANPEIGRNAALEDKAILQEVLSGSDMVFITGGMGGGTGTGAAPIIAQVAREIGALTVGVVTKPFTFEGKRRRHQSEAGIQALRQSVDTLITIPNQRLLSIAPPEMSMLDGFKLADEVLLNAVKGISDIINIPGRVNVDFADVKTIMSEMGMALMGIGTSSGPNRAAEAARSAINSPLLEDIDIEGATGILINITGTSTMTLHEISEASTLIQEAAHEDANIIFGAVIDENMEDVIRVTVIATGFDQARVSFPETTHNFGSIAQQQTQYTQTTAAASIQTSQSIPQQPFAGLNSGRQQSNFSQSIPSVNPYEVRGTQNSSHPQQTSQFIQPNYSQQRSQQHQQTGGHPNILNRTLETSNMQQNMGSGFRSAPQPPSGQQSLNQQPSVQQTEIRTHSTFQQQTQKVTENSASTTAWAQQSTQQVNQTNFQPPQRNETFAEQQEDHSAKWGQESKVYGASSSAHQDNKQEDTAETAMKLAKELSDVEIDDSDFETPAFMRRKDELFKNI